MSYLGIGSPGIVATADGNDLDHANLGSARSEIRRRAGAALVERDIRGTAPMFFTEQGNWVMDTKPGM